MFRLRTYLKTICSVSRCDYRKDTTAMNLANKLTMLRVILVPFFAFFMLANGLIPYSYLWAAIIFTIASLTDTADGKIARKYNMVTNFGKFLDPLADKLLVVTALICFVELGWASAWVTAIIVAREFAVSGVRLIAAGSENKTVIAASIWGKLKTASTMVAICVIIIMHIVESFGGISGETFPIQLTSDILMYISCILTAISGFKYIWDYRAIFSSEK